MLYEPYSDSEFLATLDAFDDRHMAIHEAARRIRRLIAEKATMRAETRQLIKGLAEEVWCDAGPNGFTVWDTEMVGQTPEYQREHRELLRRVNTFLFADQPEAGAGQLCPRCRASLRTKYLECPSCARVCTPEEWKEMQPEAKPRFRRVGKDAVVDLEARQLIHYDPKAHGDLANEGLYDAPLGNRLLSNTEMRKLGLID